ncbi:MAG TPA: secondary thiamine-phosphate synthase enzyme YjbQ [Terriglobia bacterium]|nr:secondary thiamine-phosphate synthase enzyme YjbQ [Terriglobia bacterium]
MSAHPGIFTAGSPVADHAAFEVETTACLVFIDITDRVVDVVTASGVRRGIVNVQSAHTTAAIIVNEHEPLLIDDMKRVLERLAPRSDEYRHDAFDVRTVNLGPDERPNGHAHCKAMFLRTSESLNIWDGRLQLGQWQRIFLVELDGARKRAFSINVVGQSEDWS